jgi:hypothetical protein
MKQGTFAAAGFGGLAIGIIAVLIFQFAVRSKIKYAKMKVDVQTLRSVRSVVSNLKFQHQTVVVGSISKRILVPGVLPSGPYDRLITSTSNDTLLTQDVLSNYEISLRHIDSLIMVMPGVSYYIATATTCANSPTYISYKLTAFDAGNNVIDPEVALRRKVDFLVVNPCPPADASGYPYRWP